MADTNKVTKSKMFNEIIALATEQDRQDIVEFAEHEIELLAKRKASDSKAKAKKAAENQAIAQQIADVLADADKPMATLEIATAVGISTQKATPILADMEVNGKVVKTTEKRKNFYKVA